ncbi:MAG: hypothetical protein HeimC3_06600 [Candidatus Heimdallarchaeota archaeon LC_3]|nr:MAG: hypothetical protein HeimC3_06600 [Candidatus Heimdallarchaeota archaeon LC_3]
MIEKVFVKETEEYIYVRIQTTNNPLCLIILAHGAGVDMYSDFMVLIQKYLLDRNIASICFNFGYKEKGKKLPGSKKALDFEYKAVWKYVKEKYPEFPLFIGGKSMGGRVSTRIINDLDGVLGLVFLGFPVHPPGKPDKPPEDYMFKIGTPMLFLQGSRDNFSKKEPIESIIPKLKDAELFWLERGDHSWKPSKSTAVTQEELIEKASHRIEKFCRQILDRE